MDPITRSWADLPSDLLESIRERLFGKDCTVFLSVCKNWRSVPSPRIKHIAAPVSDIVKHPFLLRFRSKQNDYLLSYCELYSPAYNKMYLIDSFDGLLGDAQIHSSNYGWLLMSQCHMFFFLNPSTGNIIKLPHLPEHSFLSFNRMGFSAPPTSLGCEVFGLVDMLNVERVNIGITKQGGSWEWTQFVDHRSWGLPNVMKQEITSKRFVHRSKSKRSILSRKLKGNRCRIPPIQCLGKFEWCSSSSPVFHNGVFYCLSKYGILGEYNPKKTYKVWRLINTTKHRAFLGDILDEPYLMESCNGELISVVVGARGESVTVLKFDENLNIWQNVSSLQNQVIFLSRTSCVVMHCDELQVKGLRNTIHFPRLHGNCNIFYSLSTKKYHTFDGTYASEDLCNTKLLLNCTWMVPNFHSFAGKELDWSSTDIDGSTLLEGALHPNYFIQGLTFLQPTDSSNCNILQGGESKRSSTTEQEAREGRPWIMLHHEGGEVVCTLMDIFGGFSDPVHNLEDGLRGKKPYASGYGQLLMMDISAGDCILLDTSSMAIRSLPTLPRRNFLYKSSLIYLSLGESSLSVIIFGVIIDEEEVDDDGDDDDDDDGGEEDATIMFCQVGDDNWTLLDGGYKVKRATFYENKIYGIRTLPMKEHMLVEVQVQPTGYDIEVVDRNIYANLRAPRGSLDTMKCLVESCGELLLFHISFAGIDQQVKVILKVEVFKYDAKAMRMEELEDLGDRAFFIDNHEHCFGCCASKSGFKKNSIYLTCSRDENIYRYDYGDDSVSTCFHCPEIKSASSHEIVMRYY
ncbi:F-box/kelch-repeat protein At1g57790 [Linum perenne]